MPLDQVLSRLCAGQRIPLWVPLLTHYRTNGRGTTEVDVVRMQDHVRHIVPHVKLMMIAGSTGDGWDHTPAQFESLLEFGSSMLREFKGVRLLVGILSRTTPEVLADIGKVHTVFGTSPLSPLKTNIEILLDKGWTGITVCPPCGQDVTQEAMQAHFAAVCAAARLPVAAYHLLPIYSVGI